MQRAGVCDTRGVVHQSKRRADARDINSSIITHGPLLLLVPFAQVWIFLLGCDTPGFAALHHHQHPLVVDVARAVEPITSHLEEGDKGGGKGA